MTVWAFQSEMTLIGMLGFSRSSRSRCSRPMALPFVDPREPLGPEPVLSRTRSPCQSAEAGTAASPTKDARDSASRGTGRGRNMPGAYRRGPHRSNTQRVAQLDPAGPRPIEDASLHDTKGCLTCGRPRLHCLPPGSPWPWAVKEDPPVPGSPAMPAQTQAGPQAARGTRHRSLGEVGSLLQLRGRLRHLHAQNGIELAVEGGERARAA